MKLSLGNRTQAITSPCLRTPLPLPPFHATRGTDGSDSGCPELPGPGMKPASLALPPSSFLPCPALRRISSPRSKASSLCFQRSRHGAIKGQPAQLLSCQGKLGPAGAFSGHTQTSDQGSTTPAPLLISSCPADAGSRSAQAATHTCRAPAPCSCPTLHTLLPDPRVQAADEPLHFPPELGDYPSHPRAGSPKAWQPPWLAQGHSKLLADPGTAPGPLDREALTARNHQQHLSFLEDNLPRRGLVWGREGESCSVAGKCMPGYR